MAKNDDVREILHGDRTEESLEKVPDQPMPRGTGTGGGLPENPEARRPSEFGPGGSAGATATGGPRGRGLETRGGKPMSTDRPSGDGDPGTRSANLGERATGQQEESMSSSSSNRERTTGVDHKH